MIQSMTGFGSAESCAFRVEIRSLNHRHTEMFIKMPSFLMEHDMAIRNLIKANFQRGKFDVNITLTDRQKYKIKTNKELAGELYKAFQDLKKELSIEGAPDLNLMLMFREIILSEDLEYNPEALFEAVGAAISKLLEMRLREGESLKKELEIILSNLKLMHEKIEMYSKNSIHVHRDNLTKKVTELLSAIAVDEARLNQEIAFIAQKSDINEELARIKSHIEHFGFVLSGDEAAGRKLDFILQEILREANTIASKIDMLDVINLVIDIKTQVEKLREQAQNIQ